MPRSAVFDGLASRRRVQRWVISVAPAAGVTSLVGMAGRAERRAAREAVAAYHEAELSALIRRAGDAIDRFSAGDLDAFETDQDLFQYGRAAKELWKFCNLGDVVSTAQVIAEQPPVDWWERGAFNRR
jgi:hypothetical protein